MVANDFLYRPHTYWEDDFTLERVLELKGDKTIAVIIPTLNEEATIGNVLANIPRNLVDEIVVIDSDSTDKTAQEVVKHNAKFYYARNIKPELGNFTGKGENLWKGLFVTKSDIVVYVDSDIQDFSDRFIRGLVGPLLLDKDIKYVKSYYDRGEFGRVSMLSVRPLLAAFFPKVQEIYQPLSGEYASFREVLEDLEYPSGYSVEISHMIDIFDKYTYKGIAQVNMHTRVHRHHSIETLSKMAFDIMTTILLKAEQYNKIKFVDASAYGNYLRVWKDVMIGKEKGSKRTEHTSSEKIRPKKNSINLTKGAS